MAPQKGQVSIAANVLGTIGTVFWCVQLIPQIWYNWKKKNTDGLPATMLFLWAVCGPPFGAYAVVQNFNIPIQIQPQMFTALALVSWAQVLIYHNKWSTMKATVLAVATGFCFAASEAILILTLRGPYNRGVEYPMIILGSVAAVIFAVGLIPPYFEILKRQGRVIGINFIFLTIDWLGAFFSLMALVAQNSFDVLGGVIYTSCLVLECGIFASQIIWLIRFRDIRCEAQKAGLSYDEYINQQDGTASISTDEEKEISKETEDSGRERRGRSSEITMRTGLDEEDHSGETMTLERAISNAGSFSLAKERRSISRPASVSHGGSQSRSRRCSVPSSKPV